MAREPEQQLGPRQLAWVEALESGKYQQTKHVLYNGSGYCCLGVACVVSGIRPERSEADINEFVFGPKKMWASLPDSSVDYFKFRSPSGYPATIHDINEAAAKTLTHLNDGGSSFAEIAQIIRANPGHYFSEPV